MAPKKDRDPFTESVINLRSHLLKCHQCRGALDADNPYAMCENGIMYSIRVAQTCEKLLATKRMAVGTINEYVYACPDLSEHGEAYALTAQPLSVVATQDGLF
jgi:hypothetical protein